MGKSGKQRDFIISLVVIVFIAYLLCPPYNKAAQIGYMINNINFFKTKTIENDSSSDYLYHRNNAVYLSKMNDKSAALREINLAIASIPNDMSENEAERIYLDRAKIRIFYKDYKGALDDMLMVKNPNINDYLKIAMLLKEQGKNKLSVSYCNKIIDMDIRAYAGYACIADVYAGVGKYDASVMIYDLLIDRVPNKAKYYADRALYKKSAGDIEGYQRDMESAKKIYPLVDTETSITYDSIHPKKLELSITDAAPVLNAKQYKTV